MPESTSRLATPELTHVEVQQGKAMDTEPITSMSLPKKPAAKEKMPEQVSSVSDAESNMEPAVSFWGFRSGNET